MVLAIIMNTTILHIYDSYIYKIMILFAIVPLASYTVVFSVQMKLPAASSGVSLPAPSPICAASGGELDPKRLNSTHEKSSLAVFYQDIVFFILYFINVSFVHKMKREICS